VGKQFPGHRSGVPQVKKETLRRSRFYRKHYLRLLPSLPREQQPVRIVAEWIAFLVKCLNRGQLSAANLRRSHGLE